MSPRTAASLRRLQSASVAHFGYPAIIEPLHEQAGTYSRVVRLRVYFANGSVRAFAKLYEPPHDSPEEQARYRRYVVNEFERIRLARACATPAATVPLPMACVPDEYLVLTREAAGEPLQARLRRAAFLRTEGYVSVMVRDMTRVGSWLRAFQRGVPIFGKPLQDPREYLDRRLRALVALQWPAFTERERGRFLDVFDDADRRMRPSDRLVVPIHADLCPSNILVRDTGVTIVDFASSTDGTRCADVAHLVMHLRLAAFLYRLAGPATDRVVRGLIGSFDGDLDEADAVFRYAMLPHLACHLGSAAERARRLPRVLAHSRFAAAVARCLAIGGLQERARSLVAGANPARSVTPGAPLVPASKV